MASQGLYKGISRKKSARFPGLRVASCTLTDLPTGNWTMLTRISIVLHTLILCLLLALASFLAGMVACALASLSGAADASASDWLLFLAFIPLPLLFLIWGCLERRAVHRGARVRALPLVILAYSLVALKMPLFPPSGLPHYLLLSLAAASALAFLRASAVEVAVRRSERAEEAKQASGKTGMTA